MQATRFAHLALAAGTAAVLMTGCGAKGMPTSVAQKAASTTQAQATKTLLDGYNNVYMAAFTKLDANNDGVIDEYEAGPFIDLRDFVAAEGKAKDGKLTKAQFMKYASEDGPFGGWFGFCHQNKNDFLNANRKQILKAFDKLDTKKLHLLTGADLSDSALSGQKLTLTIPGLKLNVVLTKFNADDFKAADHTGDGSLGQAEFEDFVLAGWMRAINPNYNPNPAPAPAPGGDTPPAPPAPPAPAPGGNGPAPAPAPAGN